jgi:SHS family lactate transporter-like MFS transporter
VRGFLPGFGYQCGVALAATASYAEAVIARRVGYATAMAGVAASVFVLAAVLAALGNERRAVKFGE